MRAREKKKRGTRFQTTKSMTISRIIPTDTKTNRNDTTWVGGKVISMLKPGKRDPTDKVTDRGQKAFAA